jgi:uncharacterized SAM-binding protein YcdF (DUF218 family)
MTINHLVNLMLPGSFPGLIIALIIGVALLHARDPIRRWARIWLTVVTILYACLSTWVGVDVVSAPLRRHGEFLATAAAANGATAVVLLTPSEATYRSRGLETSEVLGEGGALRVLEAARVYRLLGNPWLIAQGGPDYKDRPGSGTVVKDRLVRLGVPADRILIESRSENTREHTLHLRPILQAHGIQRFVLVTSAEHMWRASSVFRKAGFEFASSATSTASELPRSESTLRPSGQALQYSTAAAHEYLGLLYYWLRGWT